MQVHSLHQISGCLQSALVVDNRFTVLARLDVHVGHSNLQPRPFCFITRSVVQDVQGDQEMLSRQIVGSVSGSVLPGLDQIRYGLGRHTSLNEMVRNQPHPFNGIAVGQHFHLICYQPMKRHTSV